MQSATELSLYLISHPVHCLLGFPGGSVGKNPPTNEGGFPGGSAGKDSACNVGDLGSIPGLGRSSEEGKGYPLQCSGLENYIQSMGSQRVGHD